MKIVCVTPAGRRRYLRLLLPYVLSCPAVDRYDLWVNTPDPADLAFLHEVAAVDPRIRLVTLAEAAPGQPALPPPGPGRIRHFWSQAMAEDSVYIRLDDDVVWLDPRFFERLLDCRFARPEAFMVAPLVINNALGSFVLQSFGKIAASRRIGPGRFDAVGWESPSFAAALHALFQSTIAADEVARLDCGRLPVAATYFSINCVSWFGRDIAATGGIFPAGEDEEAAASCTLPLRAGRANCLETAAVAAHFAFYSQRLALDASGLLEGYGRIAAARPELEPWRRAVEAIYARLEQRFPRHESLGGFRPRSPGRRRWARLLGRSARPEAIAVVRGPAF